MDKRFVHVYTGTGIPAAVKPVGTDNHLIIVNSEGVLKDADFFLLDQSDAYRGSIHKRAGKLQRAQPLLLGGGDGLKYLYDTEFFSISIFAKPVFVMAAINIQIFKRLVGVKAQRSAARSPAFHKTQNPGKGLLPACPLPR